MPRLRLRDGFSGSFRRSVVTTPGRLERQGDKEVWIDAVTRPLKWAGKIEIDVTDAEAASIADDIGEEPHHSLRVVTVDAAAAGGDGRRKPKGEPVASE